jgi:hypothetical protein
MLVELDYRRIVVIPEQPPVESGVGGITASIRMDFDDVV